MMGTIGETLLTELCCKKYKDGQIKAARDMLYSATISDTSKPEFQRRKSNKTYDTTNKKLALEIYQLFQEYGSCTEVPQYAAVDLANLPLIKYDATDISGLLISHNKLEHKVVDLTERIKHCTRVMEEMVSTQTAFSESFKEALNCNTNVSINNTQNKQPFSSTKCDKAADSDRETVSEQSEGAESDSNSNSEIEICAQMTSQREELNCPDRDYTPKNESELKEHTTLHKKENRGTVCGYTSDTQEDSEAHMPIHNIPFFCYECKYNYTFNNEAELGAHMLTHMNKTEHIAEHTVNKEIAPPAYKKPLSCTICEAVFKSDNELKSHQCKQQSNTGRQCRYCRYYALNSADFVNHISTHHVDEKAHVCPVCGYKSKIEFEMMRHMITVHNIENEDITQEHLSVLSGHQCQDKIDTDSNNQVSNPTANVQMQDHTGVKIKSYACSKCDYKCRTSTDMKTHMLTHNTPEIYICEVTNCTYECESKEDLQLHKIGSYLLRTQVI